MSAVKFVIIDITNFNEWRITKENYENNCQCL